MDARKYDNMEQLAQITLGDWKETITLHQAWLWFNDLVGLVRAAHYQLDRADVMFADGNLPQRVEWLRERMEAAESQRHEPEAEQEEKADASSTD